VGMETDGRRVDGRKRAPKGWGAQHVLGWVGPDPSQTESMSALTDSSRYDPLPSRAHIFTTK
jgi:hypothetical protein